MKRLDVLQKLEKIFCKKLTPVSFTMTFILAFVNRFLILRIPIVFLLCFLPVFICMCATQYIRECILKELHR